MTRREKKLHDQKLTALRARIAAGGNLNAATLAHSYGLDEMEVLRNLRSVSHAKG